MHSALPTNWPLSRLKLNMKMKKRTQSIGNFYLRPKSFLNIYRFLWIVIRVCLYTRSYVCYIYLRQFYKGINTVLSFVTSYKFNGYTVMVVLVVWNKEILFIRCIYLNRKRLTRNTEISQKVIGFSVWKTSFCIANHISDFIFGKTLIWSNKFKLVILHFIFHF